MERTGIERLQQDGFSDDDIVIERSMEMRYLGQVHECTVQFPNGPVNAELARQIIAAFHRRHEALFTYSEPDSMVELVNVEVTVRGKVAQPSIPKLSKATHPIDDFLLERRPMIFDDSLSTVDTPVYDGERLGAGHALEGPALIEEPTTNIVIPHGWKAELHESGTYLLTRTGEP